MVKGWEVTANSSYFAWARNLHKRGRIVIYRKTGNKAAAKRFAKATAKAKQGSNPRVRKMK